MRFVFTTLQAFFYEIIWFFYENHLSLQRIKLILLKMIVRLFFIILLAMNIVTFIMFGLDKWKAKKSEWRIPESTLLWLAVAGGSIGALVGMKVWHHKTLHKKFTLGVPAILIGQVIIFLFLWMK